MVSFLFVVGEKTPALFLQSVDKPPWERTPCLNISRHARKTHPFFLNNIKKLTPRKRLISYGDRFLLTIGGTPVNANKDTHLWVARCVFFNSSGTAESARCLSLTIEAHRQIRSLWSSIYQGLHFSIRCVFLHCMFLIATWKTLVPRFSILGVVRALPPIFSSFFPSSSILDSDSGSAVINAVLSKNKVSEMRSLGVLRNYSCPSLMRKHPPP